MYLVLKTSEEEIIRAGSVFEAVRGHWSLNPKRAIKCSRIFAVTNKTIRGVFTNDKWYPSTKHSTRYVFAGEEDKNLTNKFLGKTISQELTLRAAENPVRYVEEDRLFS